MFEKLKKTFSKFVESVVSAVKEDTLSEKDVEGLVSDLYIDLVESDVAVDVADAVVDELRRRLVGVKVPRFGDRGAVIKKAIYDSLLGVLSDVPDVDFYEESRRLLERRGLCLSCFWGRTATARPRPSPS